MNKLVKFVFGGVLAICSMAQAHEIEPAASETINTIVTQKVECDSTKIKADCSDEVEAQFQSLLKSENVESILKLYEEKQVQMEMTFDNHSGGSHFN